MGRATDEIAEEGMGLGDVDVSKETNDGEGIPWWLSSDADGQAEDGDVSEESDKPLVIRIVKSTEFIYLLG